MKPQMILLTPLEERVLKLFLQWERDHIAIVQISPYYEKLWIKSLRSLERKNFIWYSASEYEMELLENGAQWLKNWGLIKDYEIINRRRTKPHIPYICVVPWEE